MWPKFSDPNFTYSDVFVDEFVVPSETWAVILTGEKYILPAAAIYFGVSLRPII